MSLDRVLPGSQLRFDHLGKPLPHLMRAAAEHIVPFTAELGGKGPFVVFADSDLDAAAKKAAAPKAAAPKKAATKA